MAWRKYRRRVSGVEPSPLSEAAHATPAGTTPQGPEQRPLDAPAPPAQEQVTPQAAPSDHAAMSLKDQLNVMQQNRANADGLHIAGQASTPLEQQLEQIPGLSVMQRAYLRERPYALTRPDILSAAHLCAQQNGIAVDSPAYFQVMDYALQDFGNIPFTTPPAASPAAEAPAPAPATQPRPAPMPDDSYAAHIASAPPSRSEYAGSMPPPDASNSRVTLSAPEREVAALSGVTEVEYAKNKLKLLNMKKAGIIRD